MPFHYCQLFQRLTGFALSHQPQTGGLLGDFSLSTLPHDRQQVGRDENSHPEVAVGLIRFWAFS